VSKDQTEEGKKQEQEKADKAKRYIENFILDTMKVVSSHMKKSIADELRDEMRRQVVIEHLMEAFDKFVPVALDGCKQYVKYYVPNSKDPLAVAVSLMCRAADIQVDATDDPEEKAKILRETALSISQLPALCCADQLYKEGTCECEDDVDEVEGELDD
jgi:hypothetical protein